MVEVRQPNRRPIVVVVVDVLEIGRECDGLLIDDTEASRRHLRVRREGASLRVSDLDSTNGTMLNGARIAGEVELRPGDVVLAGGTQIRSWSETERGSSRTSPTVARSGVPSGPTRATPGPARAYAGDHRTSIELVASSVDGRSAPIADLRGDGNTVTVVFSDIESSTEQALRLGDQRWFAVLGVHNDLVRVDLDRYGGSLIKSQGDGFMMTFPSARRAVQFARAVQRRLADHDWDGDELRVRIGMHTGEAIVDDDGDLFGKHIILAARVANEAEGGEILVSSVVKEIVSSRDDITFDAPRTVDLKGLDDAYQVFPVQWQPLESR